MYVVYRSQVSDGVAKEPGLTLICMQRSDSSVTL